MRRRRKKAGVPDEVGFRTKPQIALEQVRWGCKPDFRAGRAGGRRVWQCMRLRTGMTELGMPYVVGIQSNCLVWPPGTGPRRRGRPINNTGRRDEPDLTSVKKLARSLPRHACVLSAGGKAQPSGCPALRAGAGYCRPPVSVAGMLQQETLLIEWPDGKPSRPDTGCRPFRRTQASANSSTLPSYAGASTDYQELKQEVGLGHFEGRGWRGFDHHATMWDRRLRIPHLRAGDDSPSAVRSTALSRRLPFPPVIDPEDPPLRPERHIPNSITTVRIRPTRALIDTDAMSVLRCDTRHIHSQNQAMTQ